MGRITHSPARIAATPVAERLLRRLAPAARERLNTLRQSQRDALDPVGRYLVAMYGLQPLGTIARHLEVSVCTIHRWYRELREAGLLALDEGFRPVTTPAEREAIIRAVQGGMTVAEIARIRGIQARRIYRVLDRAGIAPTTETSWIPARAAAEMFGVSNENFCLWIAKGWFGELPRGPRNAHCLTRLDLITFVRNRAGWVAWEPVQITDAELRAVAQRERDAARGRWYNRFALAVLCGTTEEAITSMMKRGAFRGYPRQDYRAAYVWVTNDQADRIAAARGLATRRMMAVIAEEER